MIALSRCRLRWPERFASLVLMDTSARVPDDLAREPIELGGAHRAARRAWPQLAKLLRARSVEPRSGPQPTQDRRFEARVGDRY